MTNNNVKFTGTLHLEDASIEVSASGVRSIITPRVFYENAYIPFDIEAEMEVDRNKYEAMKWYNKIFCNARY